MNSFGKILKINLFGESHGSEIGITIDGVVPGIKVDETEIKNLLESRFKELEFLSKRREDDFHIISGVFNSYTTGAPVTIIFKNNDVDSRNYEANRYIFRPSHADFTAFKKYAGFNDYRGAGAFSGRIMTPLIVAGYLAKKIINDKFKLDIEVVSKLLYPDLIKDRKFLETLKQDGDSTGGLIETVISNTPIGLGEPIFDGLESKLGHALFSIPGLRALEFGKGFEIAKMKGSTANDVFIDANGKTKTNNSGGINGGISNGNDIVFRVALRPTSSISIEFETFDFKENKMTKLKTMGRHDVCFGFKVPVLIDAVTYIVLCDLLMFDRAING